MSDNHTRLEAALEQAFLARVPAGADSTKHRLLLLTIAVVSGGAPIVRIGDAEAELIRNVADCYHLCTVSDVMNTVTELEYYGTIRNLGDGVYLVGSFRQAQVWSVEAAE